MSDDPKRRDRLGAALRENLKRRKAQARDRAQEARDTAPGTGEDVESPGEAQGSAGGGDAEREREG